MTIRAWRAVRRATTVAATLGLLWVGVAPAQASPPPDPNAIYVTSVYLDLFGRLPDPTGLSTWDGLLDRRTVPRVAVANAITSSEEFRSTLIVGLYNKYLGRGPDPAGLRFWLDKMAQGWTIERIGSGFISSDEYYAAAGSTPAGWTRALYRDVLGRGAAPDEVAFWVEQQARGQSRTAVALGFLLSTEHLSTVVDGYYEHLLRRGLDPTGQATWVARLQAGGRDEDIIGGILASDEYWGIAQTRHDPFRIIIDAPQSTRIGEQIPVVVVATDQVGRIYRDVTSEAVLSYGDPASPCPTTCTAGGPVGQHTIYAAWNGLSASTSETEIASSIALLPLTYYSGGGNVVVAGSWVTFVVSAFDELNRSADPRPGALTVSDPAASCQAPSLQPDLTLLVTCTLNTPGPVHATWTSAVNGWQTSVDLVVQGP